MVGLGGCREIAHWWVVGGEWVSWGRSGVRGWRYKSSRVWAIGLIISMTSGLPLLGLEDSPGQVLRCDALARDMQ